MRADESLLRDEVRSIHAESSSLQANLAAYPREPGSDAKERDSYRSAPPSEGSN